MWACGGVPSGVCVCVWVLRGPAGRVPAAADHLMQCRRRQPINYLHARTRSAQTIPSYTVFKASAVYMGRHVCTYACVCVCECTCRYTVNNNTRTYIVQAVSKIIFTWARGHMTCTPHTYRPDVQTECNIIIFSRKIKNKYTSSNK